MRKRISVAILFVLSTTFLAVSVHRYYLKSFTSNAAGAEMNPTAKADNQAEVTLQTVDSPFACNMAALDAEGRKRHAAVTRELKDATEEVWELPDGYALRFSPSESSIMLASEFVARERLCCPFLSFELIAEKDGGPLLLQLRGREGVKAFLKAELNFKS